MKNFIKIALLMVLFVSRYDGMAQNNLLVNTLDSAKNLRDKGNYAQAIKVMETLDAQYPNNFWLLQLYAETLFWMKEYNKANNAYRRAIRIYPKNYEVKYEYALFLYDRGQYEAAHELLLLYNENYSGLAGVESLIGITAYYIGNFKEAETYLESSLSKNPDDKKTRQIYTEVSYIVKPWIKGGFLFNNDSQPLRRWMPEFSGGWYQSHFLNITFNANYQSFTTDSIITGASAFTIQNSFIIPKAGFKATTGIGGYYTNINNVLDFTWQLKLSQRLTKNLYVKAGGERSPYTYTIASIAKPFFRNRYTLSFSWETENSFNADLGYIGEFFADTNSVQTAYAWVLSPTVRFLFFRINFGYAFNYSNSRKSRFVPEQSLDDILTNYDSTKQITGVYNPYFTPANQFSNSLLVNLYVIFSKNINIKLHASAGVFSRAMNPYFYLNKQDEKTVISEAFYQEKFTPLDIGMDLNAKLSDKLMLNFSYQYLQTFYYSTNNFNIGLKINF